MASKASKAKWKGRGLSRSQIEDLVLGDDSDNDLFGTLTGDEQDSDDEYEDTDLRGRGGESDLATHRMKKQLTIECPLLSTSSKYEQNQLQLQELKF